MNKKYAVYGLLMMFLMTNMSIFSMYQLIFRGAKMIGKGTLPVAFGAFAYKQIKDYKKFAQDVDAAVLSGNDLKLVINNSPFYSFNNVQAADKSLSIDAEEWMKKKIEKFDNPALQALPIVAAYCKSPAIALGNKIVGIDPEKAEILNNALQGEIDNANEIKAEHGMVLYHELKHVIEDDTKKAICALGLIPVAVEVVCSKITRISNKICKIEAPKTFLKTVLRSSGAVGTIVPKFLIGCFGNIFYRRYQETCADQFACENAETREELEAFRNLFQREADSFETQLLSDHPESLIPDGSVFQRKGLLDISQELKSLNDEQSTMTISELALKKDRGIRNAAFLFDTEHPYLGDRVVAIQKYIDKWDTEHAGTCDVQLRERA